jgi:type IV pilus assembly protein PilM
VVDIDSLALINAFDYSYSQEADVRSKTTALLNIGSATSNLNILEDGLPALSRDIIVGGNNFTQRVADALNVDFKAAEELKTRAEHQKDARVVHAIEPVLVKLAQDVRTSFDYYESRSVTSVEKIYLSGGGSLFPGLQESLANFLSIEVSQWDPFNKILLAPNLDAGKIKAAAGQLAVAVGLALRS